MCGPTAESCLLWRFMGLLCVLANITHRSSSCPSSCACYAPSEVHCTFRYLSEIPRDIQPAVERINLGYNSLSTLKVNDLSGLKNLELLMLHSNIIKTVEDGSFHDLTSLQILKMSYNRIEKLNKDTFKGLDNLVRLHMDHNHITFIHPESFYGLRMLQLINLEGNLLQQLHPDTFISLRFSQFLKWSSLKTIYLSDNALTTLPATIFSGCNKIENLFLSGNPWSCDCRMGWLEQWLEKHPGVLKCKRDRKFLKEQCPICEFPVNLKGSSIVHLQRGRYTCSRPWIHPHLKQNNFTLDDGGYTLVSPKDFVEPIGMLEMNITDQFHNNAWIACVVQRPTGMENLTANFGPNGKYLTGLSAIISTSLVCNIDYDNIRQIWNILAMYSESPMRLEREELLSLQPGTVYTYKQVASTEDDIFTEIKAKMKANHEWLMQSTVLLQLDRITTTFPNLTIKYLSNVQIDFDISKERGDQYGWAMIRTDNETKTEHSVLAGGVIELNCQTFGDPKPIIEWTLPDGSKLRAPYNSEDQRVKVAYDGRLTLKSVEISDTGVYHCITTNSLDADVLAFRVTVLPQNIEEQEINGIRISRTTGQNLRLDCTSASSPKASVQWILPDHTILDKSYGNRKLYRNSTLVIHGLTSSDKGFYRCLVGNFLGADLLASHVTVHGDLSNSTEPKESGDHVVQIIDDSQKLGSRYLSRRVSEESRRITSGRPYTLLQSRFHKVPTGRRGNRRNSGRVFNKKYLKEDATFIDTSQMKGANKKTMSLEVSKTFSDDNDATSGDGISEDEFIVMTTSQTLEHSTIKITDVKIPETYKAGANEKTNLVTTTSHSHTQTPVTPIIATSTLSNYGTTLNTTKSDYVLSQSVGKTHIYEKTTNRPSEAAELLFSGDSEDITTATTPLYNSQGPNVTSLEPKSQAIFTAVTTTKEDHSKITFQTTQRIKSELLPGSTIISKHQIQIVPSTKMRSGKKGNFHGRRRIIRPSKITDMQSLLNKFKHLSINKEGNLTFSHTVDKITICGDGKRVTSRVSTDKCKTVDQSPANHTARFHMSSSSLTVTEKPVMTTRLSDSEKIYSVTDSQMSVTIVPTISEDSSDSKDYFNSVEKELTFTTTSTMTMSSKITEDKIQWHRKFRIKGEIKETLSKHQASNSFTLPTNKEQRTSASTEKPYKATTTTTVPTTELNHTHMIVSPPMTRTNYNSPETSFEDSSGSFSFIETNFSGNVITPSTTAEFFSVPALRELSTTTEPMGVSQTLAAPPTMQTKLKQDTVRNKFSGSQNGLWRKQKPGYHRRGSRRRRPIKKSTTKSPVITVAKNANTPATTKSTTTTSQTKHSGAILRSLHTPLEEPERSPLPESTGSGEEWRDSNMSSTTSFAEVITLTTKPTTASDKPQSSTVTSDTMTSSTTYMFTPFPYGSSTVNQNTFDQSTRYDTSSLIDYSITFKPRINGGKAASFTVLSNSDAFLPCEATGNPEPIISWNRFSSTTGNMLTIKGKVGKFEVLKNGTLFVQKANIKDQGQYICFAQNEYGSDKLVVTLSVVAYPTRILEKKMRDIKVLAGKTVHLECRTEGRPVPIVSWILPNHTEVKGSITEPGRVTVTTMGKLTIQEVSVLDRGHYKCIASNPAGADTAIVRLQVLAAPPAILEEKQQLVRANIGQNLFLACSTNGDPQPTTHWVLHDGTIVHPLTYSHTKVSVFGNGTLYLRDIQIAESGKYECIATSSTGSERRVVTLSVKRTETAPQITKTSQQRTDVIYGGHLHLNCSAVGDPKPQIIWRLPSKALVDQSQRMGSRIKVLENGTLIIESVNEKDAGDFLCVARNKVGDDVQLLRVSVSMKPARIEPNVFSRKQVLYGNDLKVDCVAAGVPMPEISWGLPDGTLVNSALQADGTEGDQFKRYTLFDNGTLFLNEVGSDEEGDYTCYAENKLGKDKMHVHISVVTAVPRIQHTNLSYAKVKPSGNIRFDCKAIGEPKPKVFWMLPSKDMIAASNDRYLVHANGSLDIRNVKLADAGEYVCMARNAAGEENKVYKLDIDGNPPIINGFNQNRTVIKDTAVKYTRKLIDCKAEGYPVPKITWIMPDNIFLTAPYYGSRINVHSNGTLEIRNVRPSDSAEFICMAQNDGGEAVMLVQLEVTDTLRRPIFNNPFNERVVTRVGKTAVLNCSADGQPMPEITWTLPNRSRFSGTPGFKASRYHLGTDGTFVIYNSSIEDTGKYRCGAKNKVGYIEKLVIFEVIHKPYILTRPKGIIRVISGQSLFLHCLTDGIQPRISWITPGGFVLARPQKSGRYHLMDNGTLVVHETIIHDRGNYMCRAKNDAGEAVLSVPVVIVAYPPQITNGPPPTVRGVAGVSVYLQCVASGVPTPEITWELPDRSILSATGKERSLDSELLHAQGTLIIRNPTGAHSGNYKCIAFNYLGRDTRTTYMTVI
ncbi:immunoglobulin superfamily member 10 [Carassius gibelio]|uniref:immunoglobulin superfamily member 10 n=1 Tax=Carassius gibelio TaxID=101364 RepID=UPI00227808C0|nr:immunoglobulin superfamily member 10 [Carassius gibelio]